MPVNIQISSRKFFAFCAILAGIVLLMGRVHSFGPGLIASEIFLTIIGLFIFGSTTYRLDKNALTYGALLVIVASYSTGRWADTSLVSLGRHFLTFHGLDEMVHADTMLFLLGLTFFVSVIAQTRMLESISFSVLRTNNGFVLPTVAILTGLVAASSAVLGGVSMVGLMIRILLIILFLAKADDEAVIFAVIVSTVLTTVCGMFLAYGEPPNLIMKANLEPYLTNAFFLRYCLPPAVGSYVIVLWNLKKRLGGKRVTIEASHMDVADIRFLHVSKYGEILEPEDERKLGSVMTVELNSIRPQRIRSQLIGSLSLIPFIGLLIWHGIDRTVPLFWASFAGFAVALTGIISIPKMRRLAFHEAMHEYMEYFFLFPLFISIALLQKSGFFNEFSSWLQLGIERLGISLIAFIQFTGACFLSALLDNNVVADFASRALHGLDVAVLHLFSMAQIAGYAVGGCWTHIGSSQSVIAYAFIQKEVDARYTPIQWIKAMTPVVVEIFVLMAIVICAESAFLKYIQ